MPNFNCVVFFGCINSSRSLRVDGRESFCMTINEIADFGVLAPGINFASFLSGVKNLS